MTVLGVLHKVYSVKGHIRLNVGKSPEATNQFGWIGEGRRFGLESSNGILKELIKNEH